MVVAAFGDATSSPRAKTRGLAAVFAFGFEVPPRTPSFTPRRCRHRVGCARAKPGSAQRLLLPVTAPKKQRSSIEATSRGNHRDPEAADRGVRSRDRPRRGG